MTPDMITGFNTLFSAAAQHRLKLSWFTQKDDGRFHCAWRDAAGSCDEAVHERPFDAARDAFFLAIGRRDLVAPAIEDALF